MTKMSESVESFFKAEEIDYEELREASVYEVRLWGQAAYLTAQVALNEEERLLRARATCPFIIPADKRASVAELTTRINGLLATGSLSLDMESGWLISTEGMRLGDLDLNHEMIGSIICRSMWLMDVHIPVFAAVVFGSASPKDALTKLTDLSLRRKNDDSSDYIRRFDGRRYYL